MRSISSFKGCLKHDLVLIMSRAYQCFYKKKTSCFRFNRWASFLLVLYCFTNDVNTSPKFIAISRRFKDLIKIINVYRGTLPEMFSPFVGPNNCGTISY